jgi:hypothetical protein
MNDQTVRDIILENALDRGADMASSTADKEVKAAPGAGKRLLVSAMVIYNAAGSAQRFDIKDGTTIKMSVPAPSDSGAIITFPKEWPLTANTALNSAAGASVSGLQYVSAITRTVHDTAPE